MHKSGFSYLYTSANLYFVLTFSLDQLSPCLSAQTIMLSANQKYVRTNSGNTHNMPHLTPQLTVNRTHLLFNDKPIYVKYNYFDTLAYS